MVPVGVGQHYREDPDRDATSSTFSSDGWNPHHHHCLVVLIWTLMKIFTFSSASGSATPFSLRSEKEDTFCSHSFWEEHRRFPSRRLGSVCSSQLGSAATTRSKTNSGVCCSASNCTSRRSSLAVHEHDGKQDLRVFRTTSKSEQPCAWTHTQTHTPLQLNVISQQCKQWVMFIV